MNPKVAKWSAKIGVTALATMAMGIAYKLEKQTQEKIDAKYDNQTDEDKQDTDV